MTTSMRSTRDDEFDALHTRCAAPGDEPHAFGLNCLTSAVVLERADSEAHRRPLAPEFRVGARSQCATVYGSKDPTSLPQLEAGKIPD